MHKWPHVCGHVPACAVHNRRRQRAGPDARYLWRACFHQGPCVLTLSRLRQPVECWRTAVQVRWPMAAAGGRRDTLVASILGRRIRVLPSVHPSRPYIRASRHAAAGDDRVSMQDQPRECSIRWWWWSGRQLLRMFQAACGWHHSRSPPQLQLSVHTAIWSVAIPLLTAAAIATITSAAVAIASNEPTHTRGLRWLKFTHRGG